MTPKAYPAKSPFSVLIPQVSPVAYAFNCRVMVYFEAPVSWSKPNIERPRTETTVTDDCFLFTSDHENPPSFGVPSGISSGDGGQGMLSPPARLGVCSLIEVACFLDEMLSRT